MNIRYLEPRDYDPIIAVIDTWWGRQISHLLPRIFFTHFRPTSFAVVLEKEVIGFLVGFVSQTDSHEAYIHFVGIHPGQRMRGLGRLLYSRFFEVVCDLGCNRVRCITSHRNVASIAFHTRLGFEIERITGEHLGVPCTVNYELNGEDRVLFVKQVS